MATLSQQLIITSTTTSSDALSISTSDSLNVTEPSINVARISIATGSAQTILPALAGTDTYVYIKAISGTASTDYVDIEVGGSVLFQLRIGENLWFPLYGNKLIRGQAYGNAVIVEYGQWSVS